MTDSAAQATTTGRIVWFEVPAGDTARARSFYGDLFGWQFQPYEGQVYHMTYEAGGAIFAAPETVSFGGYSGQFNRPLRSAGPPSIRLLHSSGA